MPKRKSLIGDLNLAEGVVVSSTATTEQLEARAAKSESQLRGEISELSHEVDSTVSNLRGEMASKASASDLEGCRAELMRLIEQESQARIEQGQRVAETMAFTRTSTGNMVYEIEQKLKRKDNWIIALVIWNSVLTVILLPFLLAIFMVVGGAFGGTASFFL